jgi:hypothetical protein
VVVRVEGEVAPQRAKKTAPSPAANPTIAEAEGEKEDAPLVVSERAVALLALLLAVDVKTFAPAVE